LAHLNKLLFEITNLQNDIRNYYINQNELKIYLLKEEANIARNLNAEDGIIIYKENQIINNDKIVSGEYYSKGFKELESEIQQLEKRNDFFYNSDDIIYRLEQTKSLIEDEIRSSEYNKNLDSLFQETHLLSFGEINKISTDVEVSNRKKIYFALTIIFSLLISVLFTYTFKKD
jgi:hypothetical protein